MAAALGLAIALGAGGCRRAPAPAEAPTGEDPLALGAAVYEQHCVMCHFDGKESLAAPPLVGSEMVRSNPVAHIAAILHGLENVSEVNGKKFGGVMPASNGLSDEEVAAVVTYCMRTFAGVDTVVTAADVAKQR